MTTLDHVAAAGVLAIAVTGAILVAYFIQLIVRQQRAERALVRLLVQDRAFLEALADYVEAVYREGVAPAERVEAVAAIIRGRLPGLEVGSELIREGLDQPTVTGRLRYVQKLSEEAVGELVDIPLAELELAEGMIR